MATHFQKISSGFFVLSACALVSPTALAQSGQPNIVIILADDLGYGDVRFNGCPDYATPNIDSMAINGVLCTNGYVTHPFCSPSRAALLTGRYQQRFGHENQPSQDAANPRLGVPAQELLLAQILGPQDTFAVRSANGIWESRQICILCNGVLMSSSVF